MHAGAAPHNGLRPDDREFISVHAMPACVISNERPFRCVSRWPLVLVLVLVLVWRTGRQGEASAHHFRPAETTSLTPPTPTSTHTPSKLCCFTRNYIYIYSLIPRSYTCLMSQYCKCDPAVTSSDAA